MQNAVFVWQAREVAALGTPEQLHLVEGRKPSGTTRSRTDFVPAPEMPNTVECSRHRLLRSLSDADFSQPLLVRITDAAMDTEALLRSWELHIQTTSCKHTSYKTASERTEGAHRTLLQAWEGDVLAIQHDRCLT